MQIKQFITITIIITITVTIIKTTITTLLITIPIPLPLPIPLTVPLTLPLPLPFLYLLCKVFTSLFWEFVSHLNFLSWLQSRYDYRVARNFCRFFFPQIKIIAHIFPVKIYSRVNILQLKFATQKYSTKKSCLFNHNLSLSFRNKTVYNEILVYCLKICISIARTQ